jgi:hypothetical protein
MSMPHPKVLFATGCVVTLDANGNVVVYKDAAAIKKLHPWFKLGTNADDIVGQTASLVSPMPSDDIHLTQTSVRLNTRHVIWRINAGMASPKKVPSPYRIQATYFAWIMKG